MAGDQWLSDTDLAVLARLLRKQRQVDARSSGLSGPVEVSRVELHIGVDAQGRRFIARSPVGAADPDVLQPTALQPEVRQPIQSEARHGQVDPRRWRGSLLAGAVADALGAPIESKPMDQIREVFGTTGITGLVPERDGIGRITDDTQMTLFTGEALIRAHAQRRREGAGDVRYSTQLAYQRWLHTQGVPWEKARGPRNLTATPDGWLMGVPGLFKRRAPGATCFFALKGYGQTGELGTFTHTLNNSKGCGGVMRAAPAALWSDDPAAVFEIGAMTAALTHSHPSGYLPAGALAVMVHTLVRGGSLADALAACRAQLFRWNGHEETTAALDAAVDLSGRGAPTPEKVGTLGGGNVGETALSIAVYSALATNDLNAALLVSVNHDGDSDSTGAVCGNLVGALYGEDAIEPTWLAQLELREVIEAMAADLLAEFGPRPPTDDRWATRYPND